jgi:hypothetical protein
LVGPLRQFAIREALAIRQKRWLVAARPGKIRNDRADEATRLTPDGRRTFERAQPDLRGLAALF